VNGHQRREIDKLVEWLRTEPPPDVVTLPYTLLIALARPLREVTGRPVVCTLQGEELFLDGLPEPWRTQSLNLIRAQLDEVAAFIAVSRYSAEFMAGYLGIPSCKLHVVPLGINLDGHGMEPRHPSESFGSYLARMPRAPTLSMPSGCCALTGVPPVTLEVAATWPVSQLPGVHRGNLRGWGPADRFHYTASWTAPARF
jgi:hypothetical protein